MLSATPYTLGSETINGFYYYSPSTGTIYSGYTASGSYTIDGGTCTIDVTVTNTSTHSYINYDGAALFGFTPDF